MDSEASKMLSKETLEALGRIKMERGFASLDEVVRWLIARERRLRLLEVLEVAWNEKPSEDELERLVETLRFLRISNRWLTR